MSTQTAELADLKVVHDLARAANPDAKCPQPCRLCDLKETDVTDPTFTKEQLDAAVADALAAALDPVKMQTAIDEAVAAAVGPLQAELETHRAAAAGSEIEAAVAAATEPLTQAVATAESERDAAIAKATAADEARDALQATIDADAEAALKSERQEARTAEVKALDFWDDTWIAERAESFADLADDEWAAKLTDLTETRDTARAAAGIRPKPVLPPSGTAFKATAGEGGAGQPSASSRLIAAQRDSALSKTRK